MTKDEFIDFVQYEVDTYGVRSYLDNIESDPLDADDDDIWFECPECGEMVHYLDYAGSDELDEGYCPICGFGIEETTMGRNVSDLDDDEEEDE